VYRHQISIIHVHAIVGWPRWSGHWLSQVGTHLWLLLMPRWSALFRSPWCSAWVRFVRQNVPCGRDDIDSYPLLVGLRHSSCRARQPEGCEVVLSVAAADGWLRQDGRSPWKPIRRQCWTTQVAATTARSMIVESGQCARRDTT